jgi:predicted RNA-binding protein with PUA-like domain
MKYWLFKSEPDVFGIADLKKKKTATWDGVRNYQVRNLLRDEMQVGDVALFYHSSCKHVGVAGEMEVASAAFPDPLQFDPTSEYYDKGSTKDNPRWLAVKVQYRSTLPTLVPLTKLRSEPALAKLRILERGNRLSITELTAKEYARIVTLGGQQ